MGFDITGLGSISSLLEKGLDIIFPDPEKKANAQAALIKAKDAGELNELTATMQVMIAEAKSQDKWTSRARPSFMYVMYTMILTAIPMGVLYAFNPEMAANIAKGMKEWLSSIPEAMWWLFGVGYTGYSVNREIGKGNILKAITKLGGK